MKANPANLPTATGRRGKNGSSKLKVQSPNVLYACDSGQSAAIRPGATAGAGPLDEPDADSAAHRHHHKRYGDGGF